MMSEIDFIPYVHEPVDDQSLSLRSVELYAFANKRRSIRHFSDRDVPIDVIRNIVLTAGTSPSGAHKEPWKFCLVRSPEMKKQIREAAEAEEAINYSGRMNEDWLRDLAPLGTDSNKPFLETAPWLIVVFKQIYRLEEGKNAKITM